MWRPIVVHGIGSSTEDEASGLEPEFGESRGAREQLGVDVELTETANDPRNSLVSTAMYQPGSISKHISSYVEIGLTGGYVGSYMLRLCSVNGS